MIDQPKFVCNKWSELDTDTLYKILALRQEIFVVEQNCPYLDADGKDQYGYHITTYDGDTLVAYTRILPRGVSYQAYASIGRVVIKESFRGRSLGYPLMQYSVDKCHALWANEKIKISAQAHLKGYYTKCGFEWTGEEYLEDDIPHIGMVYK